MIKTTELRSRVSIILPFASFFLAYFFTTVLGNILYTFPIGRDFPKISMPDFTWEQFHQPFGVWFWLLILSPLIFTPIGSFLTARISRSFIKSAVDFIPEFSVGFFAVVNLALLAYISFHLYQANALSKLLAGRDPLDAVRYRFALQEQLGLLPRFLLMSPVQFLSTYAVVRALRSREWFWIFFAIFNVCATSVFFVLLNMKWPIVLFEITIAAAAFVAAPRRYIAASSSIFFFSIITYFMISVALLRIPTFDSLPEKQIAASDLNKGGDLNIARSSPLGQNDLPQSLQNPPEAKRPSDQLLPPVNSAPPLITDPPEHLPLVTDGPPIIPLAPPKPTAFQIVGSLAIVAINRMAMAVPFYYDVFTTKGPICGSFFQKTILRRPGTCHPSIFIYSRMFPDDGFNGRGTAPAAHQIYEYARSGWIGAIVALIIGSAIIGLYTVFYFFRENSIFATAFVMGIPAAYSLSQLPVDAVIFSEIGALWWVIVILLNSATVGMVKKFSDRVSLVVTKP